MRVAPWLTWSPLALLAGSGQAVALADPWTGQSHGWLQLLTLAWLVWLLGGAQPRAAWRGGRSAGSEPMRPGRRGFLIGWLFGLGWLGGTFWWLFISMHTYGGLPAPLAVAAVLALAALLAIYYGLAAALFFVLYPALVQSAPGLLALVFAALWTLAELARGSFLTGFPWGAGAYAHVDGLLNFLPRYVGVYGLGFVAAALAALLVLLPRLAWRRWTTWVVLVLMAGGAAALVGWRHCDIYPCYTPPPGSRPATLKVELLQGNIPQDEKFVPGTGVLDSLRWYGEQLQAAQAPLVVAPETALPLLPRQLPEGYWDALQARYREGEQAALVGVPLGDLQAGYTNSVVGFGPGEVETYRYDKHHLVPFGEFIPRFFKWFTQMMNIPMGDFSRGALVQPSMLWRGQRLAPNICYEDLFGEELAARFADPLGAPTVFVNLSNIAWFGDSVAIDQHLAISRMRALEFERPMLRATNTGATAIIDHRGQVMAQLARLTRGVLRGEFEGRTQITPYARWVSVAGLWPLWAWCLAVVLWGCWRRRR